MQTIIVTGGGRGIGAAIARMAAGRGYAVVVNYVSQGEAAARVVAEIQQTGNRAISVQGDVSQEADVMRLFETADKEFGAPTFLVNNAAITGGFARVDQVSSEMLSRVFGVNVTGPFLCSREAVKRMSTKRGGSGGSIVNISSRAARIGSAGEWVHYAASKGAVDTLTIGLAREVASEGIRVNCVAAGLALTEMHAAAGEPGRPERYAPTIPMGRGGAPEEFAEAVLWLASPAASYVTGAILDVAGGR